MRSLSLLVMVLIFAWSLNVTYAQEDELALIESVAVLQSQLDSDSEAEQDKAEQKLIGMGVEILDYLRPTDENSTSDYRQRLAKIRKSLEKESVNAVAQASKVSINGTFELEDVFKRIKNQTGNELAIADGVETEEVSLQLEKAEFWAALNELKSAANLEIDRYGSEKPNQLKLVPKLDGTKKKEAPSCFAKIFQAEVQRVDSSVNLDDERLDYTSVNLLIRWEPRLTPISVDIPLADVKILDEFGESVPVRTPDRVLYGTVQPEIPEVEFSLQFPRVDRQVENLKSLAAKIVAVIPGRAEQFRFENVGKLKVGHKLSKAGALVTYGGIQKNEELYGVKVSLSFDEENNALESHQGWVFNNEVYLQDRQGNREESLTMETFRQDNEMVTVQYYFLKEPGDRTLVYKTPATIIKLPVEIELKKIPLP